MKIGMWGAGFSQVPASLGTPSTQRVRPSPSFCALGAQCPPSGQGEITQIPFFETWAEGDASRGEHPALQLWGAQGGGQATPRPQSRDRQGRSLKGSNPARSKPMENRGGCSPSSVCGEGAQGLRQCPCVSRLPEDLQGWRLQNLSEKLVQVFDHPHRKIKKVFYCIQKEFQGFEFVPMASCPITCECSP